MKLLVALLVLVVLAAACGLIVMYSGTYDISTTQHDNALVNWVLDTGMTHSVQHHAKGIRVPSLSDSTLIDEGFRQYRACVGCHGAPGMPPGPMAKGLWPEAPDLAKTASDWTPAELYWIIRNGIKFTAMPAWGPTRDDTRLWALTAFVARLPHISAAQYQDMMRKAGMPEFGGPRPGMMR